MFKHKLPTMEIFLYYFLAIEGAHIDLHTHPKVTDDLKNPRLRECEENLLFKSKLIYNAL